MLLPYSLQLLLSSIQQDTLGHMHVVYLARQETA